MRFDIITILPKAFDSYLNASLLARAQGKNLIDIYIHNLRDYATDPHSTVDDRPYGGGAGMVLRVDILAKALQKIIKIKKKTTRIILFSASGKPLTQKKIQELKKKYKQLVLICGRFEGFDARINKLVDEEISIGDYILTGGELPAMVLIDGVSRLVSGVLGKEESLLEESFNESTGASGTAGSALLEYPHYTRPESFKWKGKNYKVPKILTSGHHAKIAKWRKEQSEKLTRKRRPDLLKRLTKPNQLPK